ncbi:hypothetical protein TruAng_007755 [Truncatella angustata]|nr:hypothetical protein TruAng_007755 [Truncatella angustata]
MAQLIDGLPTASIARKTRGSGLRIGHPIYRHTEICDPAIPMAKEFRETFDPLLLVFDTLVIQRFQKALPGSRSFQLSLLELMARSVHQIAVHLCNLEPKLHTKEDIASVLSWRHEPETVEIMPGEWYTFESRFEPHPTLFFQGMYMDSDQYPDGLADVAGYWAEDLIFGGVVLFQHTVDENELGDAFLHTGRQGANQTIRVWRPTDSQLADLMLFLTSDPAGNSDCPLPLMATSTNYRVDDWDAMAIYGIFRDRWERKLPQEKDVSNVRLNSGDYPELEQMFVNVNSGPSFDIPVASRSQCAPVDRNMLDEPRNDNETLGSSHSQGGIDASNEEYDDLDNF